MRESDFVPVVAPSVFRYTEASLDSSKEGRRSPLQFVNPRVYRLIHPQTRLLT